MLVEGVRGNKSQLAQRRREPRPLGYGSLQWEHQLPAVACRAMAGRPASYLLAMFFAGEPSFRFVAIAAMAGLFTSCRSTTLSSANVMTRVSHP